MRQPLPAASDLARPGGYASNSEVIREALRLLQAQERTRGMELAGLRQKIAEGRTSGEPVSAEQLFDRLEANTWR